MWSISSSRTDEAPPAWRTRGRAPCLPESRREINEFHFTHRPAQEALGHRPEPFGHIGAEGAMTRRATTVFSQQAVFPQQRADASRYGLRAIDDGDLGPKHLGDRSREQRVMRAPEHGHPPARGAGPTGIAPR